MNSELRKAAVLIQCLPRAERARLVERLEPLERAALAQAIGEAPDVGPVEQRAVLEELAARSRGNLDPPSAKREPVRAHVGAPRPIAPPQLAACLARERPATIAAALLRMDPSQAVQILVDLPMHRRGAVLRQLCTMTPPPAEILGLVQQTASDLADLARTKATPAFDGASRIAEWLRLAEPESSARLRSHLEHEAPDLARWLWQPRHAAHAEPRQPLGLARAIGRPKYLL